MKRLSLLSGQMVETAGPAKPVDPGKPEGTVLQELRALLDQALKDRDAAQAALAELSGRVSTLERLVEKAMDKPAPQIPAPVVNIDRQPPVTWEAVITKRDTDQRMEKMIIRPASESPRRRLMPLTDGGRG